MMARRPLVAGNWKMNGLGASAARAGQDHCRRGRAACATSTCMVCPPATLIASFAARARGTRVAIGGQDCHAQRGGRLYRRYFRRNAQGCRRERRHRRPFRAPPASWRNRCRWCAPRRWRRGAPGSSPSFASARRAPSAMPARRDAVVRAQLDGSLPDGAADFVVAYEPVWAIGTGADADARAMSLAMHGFIRERLAPRYGEAGRAFRFSMAVRSSRPMPRNCSTIDNVDGALVGGASLNADEFLAIAGVYR